MSTADDQASPTPSKSKKLLILIAIVIGVVGGGGAGVYMAGPLLAGSLPTPTAAAHSESNADSADGDDGEKPTGGKQAASAPLHLVENMVLNPARSGGARFLLLSVAFAVRDAEVVKSMTERDPELRDLILRDLGAREVEELADITRRDSIKVQLRTAVQKRFGKDAVRDVYFPQFVIQ